MWAPMNPQTSSMAASTAQMAEAQVAVEEARIRLSLFRAEAAGLRGRGKD